MPDYSFRAGGVALFCTLLGFSRLASAAALVRLEVGKTIERPDIVGGTADLTEFVLPEGGFARILVEQRNAGVRVAVQGPDGKEIDWTDETGTWGPEFISVLGGPAGVYRLEIRNDEPPDSRGPVLVTLLAAREAGPLDERHLKADREFRDANVERRRQDAASIRRGIAIFDLAIADYHAVGDVLREAETIYRRGRERLNLNEYDAAAADFETAKAIFVGLGHRQWEAKMWHFLGRVHLARAELPQARELLERALQMRLEVGDRDGQAYSMFNLGLVWGLLGERARALELFRKTLPIHIAHHDELGRIETLNAMATLEAEAGSFQEALGYYDQVIAQAAEEIRNPQTLAASLALQGKARVYLVLGDRENAEAASDEALRIARRLQNQPALASGLELAGDLELRRGETRRASGDLEEARALRRASGDRTGEARTLGRIGLSLAQAGDHAGALARFDEAQSIDGEVGNNPGVAATLLLQAAELASLGRFADARLAAQAALPICRAGDDQLGEGNALYWLALAQRALGLSGEALENVRGAIDRFESLRRLLDSPELRTMWRATTQGAFELLVELLMDAHAQDPSAGHDVEALLASERGRARGLIESLGAARAGAQQDVPEALRARRAELTHQANALEYRRARAQSDRSVAAPGEGELRAVLAEARELDGKILARSPGYAAASQLPSQQTLADLQQQIDGDTLLLEYALGERRSFLWVLSRSAVRSLLLPPGPTIEARARALHAALTARNAEVNDATVAARRARITRADAEAGKNAAALSRMILGPVAGELGGRRLVIVADGALRLIPFAALPDPVVRRQPLAARHEIESLPSAGVLIELRRIAPRPIDPSLRVAVIADPVYEASDERVHGAAPQPLALASRVEVTRAALDTGLLGFPRLRFSRQEADAVAALAPGQVSSSLDFAASREAATSARLAQAPIIHFATHSLMNTVHPELSGLVLSLVDERGAPRDGFFRLHEIYDLDLHAGLVVLSACQTAVGKEFKGEGLVALTRGFLAAGATRVIASLWSVDDRATAELMKRFYRALLLDKLAPGAALRRAQLELSRDPRWKAPYHWAGFGLQGDWR